MREGERQRDGREEGRSIKINQNEPQSTRSVPTVDAVPVLAAVIDAHRLFDLLRDVPR